MAARESAPVAISGAAQWIEQFAHGVQHAHDRGILHRDLKPGNILLADVGELVGPTATVKVGDFGLAKPVETDSNLTRTGAVIGTPNYMRRSRQLANLPPIQRRTSTCGAGTLRAARRCPPFSADSPIEILQLVREQEPIPPRKLRPAIPPATWRRSV